MTYEDRSGGTVSGAVLPSTGQPYIEALNTRRYDFGGNVRWVLGGRLVLSTRFSATDQDHRHQFGDDIEKDRHGLLFGEVSLKGTAGKTHGWWVLPISGIPFVPATRPALHIPTWCPDCSRRTITTLLHG